MTLTHEVLDLADLEVPTSTNVAPKGFVPYRPKGKTGPTVERILGLYAEMAEADALPIGPRAVGYRLKERYVGEYTKKDFEKIGKIVKRLQQAGRLPWQWVADGSSITHEVHGYADTAAFLADAHRMYDRDRRHGQDTVVEVYCEARETLGLIRRTSAERGVSVYSGGGSCGPNLARKVAQRAVNRAVQHGQSTVLLGVCDFDQAGIRNVLRPHIEHISAFVHGTAGNDYVVASKDDQGDSVTFDETEATLEFRQVALTGEMALELVETDDDWRRVVGYLESGTNAWDRDLGHLDRVQKIETEAIDPVALRDLLIGAIEAVVDTDVLTAVVDNEQAERANLAGDLARLAERRR